MVRKMSDVPATEVRVGRVRGAVVRPMLAWCARTLGNDTLLGIADRLPRELGRAVIRDAPGLGVSTTGWYDERLAGALTRGVLDAVSTTMTAHDALRAIGQETIDASLNRMSRALVAWFASPQASALAAPVLWSLYHDTGAVSARVEGSSMFAICRDWVPHDEPWCQLIGACARRVLEINGCVGSKLAMHTCGAGRGPCAMTLTWEGRATATTARAAP